jgi:hypothetical protein
MATITTTSHNGAQGHPEIVATFNYTDEGAKFLYQACRYEPGFRDGDRKSFAYRRRSDDDHWVWGLNAGFYVQNALGDWKRAKEQSGAVGRPFGQVRRVLYRLPELFVAAGRPIFFPEGEGKVEALRAMGLVATCFCAGAGGWLPDYGDSLRGKSVLLMPDNDASGRRWLGEVGQGLHVQGLCARLQVLELPGLPAKGDIVDWLKIPGNDKTLFLELARAAPDFESATAAAEVAGTPRLLPIAELEGSLPVKSPIELLIEGLKNSDEGVVSIYRHPEILEAMAGQAESNPAEHALCREFLRREGLQMPDFDRALAPHRKILRYQNSHANGNGNGSGNGDARGDGADDKPVIVITAQADEVNDQAIAALAGDPELYQRGNLLMRLVWPESGPPRIVVLQKPTLRERLAARAKFMRQKDGELIAALPPDWCVQADDARGTYPGIRPLAGVVDHPVLRPDGTILDQAGYDPVTSLYYTGLGTLALSVPAAPTHAQARDAADELFILIQDFPFAGLVHKACWFAALLTPLARFAFAGPTPLFLIDGNVPGAGKGLLAHVIGIILSGQRFPTDGYPEKEEELTKKITSMAIAGDRTVLLDNIAGRFGNATLDRALTSTCWKDRLLGGNSNVVLPLSITWYATGNNISLGDDIMRRICYVRLESPLERPGERPSSEFRFADLAEHVTQHRARLLSAALTILRAYFVAGQPKQQLLAWGSFEAWSEVVRGALVWLGLPDPATASADLHERADLAGEHMRALLAAWHELDDKGEGLTAGDVIERIRAASDKKSRPLDPPPAALLEIKEALEGMSCRLEGPSLGYRLRKHARRIFAGFFVERAGKAAGRNYGVRWIVRPASELRRGPGSSPSSPSTQTLTATGGTMQGTMRGR